MEKNGEVDSKKSQKKTNLLDHNSIKHTLDQSVTEMMIGKGYPEDVNVSNIRLLIGTIIIFVALFAQFYNQKFPENRNYLIGCIALYAVLIGILQLITYVKEETANVFMCLPQGSFHSTGLLITSKLPRFSDMYTIKVASADSQTLSTKPPVKFAKSVTEWFTKDGVLQEGILCKDVERIIVIADCVKGIKRGR